MWYSLSGQDGRIEIKLLPSPSERWEPEILQEHPLPPGQLTGRDALLSGRAPLWMYAHAAAVAARDGAASIRVLQPHEREPILVYPIEHTPPPDQNWLRCGEDPAGCGIIEFLAPPPGAPLWDPAVLGSLPAASQTWHKNCLILTGPGANWMYAAAAAQAALLPGRSIGVFSPLEAQVFVITPCPPGAIRQFPPESLVIPGPEGRVVGVVGDPNSGKSVFSTLLCRGLLASGKRRVWKKDCDYQAPTPHWYLLAQGGPKGEEAARLRREQKRPWTLEAHDMLARELQNCRRSLEWTIADLPGGNHSVTPPQRMPEGRHILFREADAFIIVARRDQAAAVQAWRDILAERGLPAPVIGVVWSCDPGADLALSITPGSPFEITASGLDRRNTQGAPVTANLNTLASIARLVIAACPPAAPSA